MWCAGYVLAGGKSIRMGRDKALLRLDGVPLVVHAARLVQAATGTATVVGSPEKYRSLGYPVVADSYSGAGPLAGIHAALSNTGVDWNLVVACDLPALSCELLCTLSQRAFELESAGSSHYAVVPLDAKGRLQPLCAFYHRRILAQLEAVLRRGNLKVKDFLGTIPVSTFPMLEQSVLRNVNTPGEWSRFLASRRTCRVPRNHLQAVEEKRFV